MLALELFVGIQRHDIRQRRRLRLPREKVVDIFEDRGNQVSASLPSALHEAIATGRLTRGQTALLVGTGAGVTMGGVVLRY